MIAFAIGQLQSLAETIIEMGRDRRAWTEAGLAGSWRGYARCSSSRSAINTPISCRSSCVSRSATRCGCRTSSCSITKQMLYFDRYAKSLAPKLNMFTDPRIIHALMQDLALSRGMGAKSGPPPAARPQLQAS